MKLDILQTTNPKNKEKKFGLSETTLAVEEPLKLPCYIEENSKASAAATWFVELGVHFVLLSDQIYLCPKCLVSLFLPQLT